MELRETTWKGVEWRMHLAQDWDQWQALVNMVMKLQAALKAWNLTKGLCSMELVILH
jgi:hypothetical protein